MLSTVSIVINENQSLIEQNIPTHQSVLTISYVLCTPFCK